jgi:GTP-binding protein
MSKWSQTIFKCSYGVNDKNIPCESVFEFAFTGKSNAGKSSLINALTDQKKLAKVSQKPGLTLTINRFFCPPLNVGFLDLPGWGYMNQSHQIRNYIANHLSETLKNIDSLKTFLWLMDCRREPNESDAQALAWMKEMKKPIFLILTKADKLNQAETYRKKEFFKNFSQDHGLSFDFVSVKDLASIESLRKNLIQKAQEIS